MVQQGNADESMNCKNFSHLHPPIGDGNASVMCKIKCIFRSHRIIVPLTTVSASL